MRYIDYIDYIDYINFAGLHVSVGANHGRDVKPEGSRVAVVANTRFHVTMGVAKSHHLPY